MNLNLEFILFQAHVHPAKYTALQSNQTESFARNQFLVDQINFLTSVYVF